MSTAHEAVGHIRDLAAPNALEGVPWAVMVMSYIDDIEPDEDPDPCDSEIWSWDYYRPEQVDPYWIRCTRLGKHNTHEDSNTGAKWTDEDAA